MSTKTQKPSAAVPRTFVDVHPNVILVHAGEPSEAEIKFVTLGQRDPDGVLDVVLKGLAAQKRKLKVTRFNAVGHPVKS